MIPHRLFDSDKPFFLRYLVTLFYESDDVPRALRPFATGCVKLQLSSIGRGAWRHNGDNQATSLDLVVILNVFVVNTFDTTFFSHVIIGVDHGRERVTATTP